jgi:hypothetical protein
MKQWTASSLAAALTLAAMVTAAEAQVLGDRISAGLVAGELKAMGYTATIDTDQSGDPRVSTTVDDYDWSVYFYDCDTGGVTDERACVSFQLYSGYSVAKTFPMETINKWNTEKRYAKAYTYLQKDGSNSARIEIDVLMEGTQANPVQIFRAYFIKMRSFTEAFRKAIGFK